MSKSAKKIGGAIATGGLSLLGDAAGKMTKASYDGRPATDYANYLANYDTRKTDNTLSNLQQYALNESQKINDMGDWDFSADASEAARRRAEEATYNQYMDYLRPEFERQTSDYATMLQNQGLPVGSEAYERAMSDLRDRQNIATNNAVYQSVLAGQDAFSQSLNDKISAGNYGNNAKAAYLAQILGALGEAPSEFDIQGDIYAVRSNKAANDYTARQQTAANRINLLSSLLSAGSRVAGGMSGGAGA